MKAEPNSTLKVIINADDLGLSTTVNAHIFDLMARGRVSSASILAGGEAFEDACRQAIKFDECSFGVHLYLTEFRPLTGSPVFADCGLLSSKGEFNSNIRRVRPNRHLKEAIYKEWCAQLDRARNVGLSPCLT